MLNQNTVLKACIAIALVVILALSIQTCRKNNQARDLQDKLTTTVYNNKMVFDSVRAKDGTLITNQEQLIANKTAEIVKRIEKENQLKELKSQVVIKTVYQIQKVYVPYKDSVLAFSKIDSVNGKPDTTDFIAVPARIVSIDTNMQLDVTVLKTGLEINYLKIPNTTTVTIGRTKGLFKKQSIVRIKNSNPHILTEDMKNIIVDDPASKKKQGQTFGIGFGTGVGTIVLLEGAYLIYHAVTGK